MYNKNKLGWYKNRKVEDHCKITCKKCGNLIQTSYILHIIETIYIIKYQIKEITFLSFSLKRMENGPIGALTVLVLRHAVVEQKQKPERVLTLHRLEVEIHALEAIHLLLLVIPTTVQVCNYV